MGYLIKNTRPVSWGEPAQIADSKERGACGKCGAMQGIYGKHFGIGADGNPVPVEKELAFDITQTDFSISCKCWNCSFSYQQIFQEGEPTLQPGKSRRKKKKRKQKRKKSKKKK